MNRKKFKKELTSLYNFNLKENIFLNEKLNNEKEIKKNNESNEEKDNINLKITTGYNSIKQIVQGIKIGKNIPSIVKEESFINALKIVCKSSMFFYIGIIVGGIVNVDLIIYEGNLFTDYFYIF